MQFCLETVHFIICMCKLLAFLSTS